MESRDRTVVLLGDRHQRQLPPLEVQYPGPHGRPVVTRLTTRVSVGRDSNCDINLQDQGISRQHLEIYPKAERWWVRDLGSSNGTFLNGKRIQQSPLPKEAKISFFKNGPVLRVSSETGYSPAHTGSGSSDIRAYTDSTDKTESNRLPATGSKSSSLSIGHRDRTVRRHRRLLAIGMTTATLLLVIALVFIFNQQRDRREMLTLASEIFYQAKSMELELSSLKQQLSERPDAEIPAAVQQINERLNDMQQRYIGLTEEMQLIGSHRSREDLLIFRVARIFGEYDLTIPDDFVQEVKRYIRKWQQSGRLAKAISRINASGRGKQAALAMRKRELPAQFLYLAVQESNFSTDAIGPQTRFGIPKGMWQFLPQTAAEYGLTLGPEKEKRVFDPRDDRFDFEKSTNAAAEYLRFLYTTEAQGSGLLVMSAYNWGQTNLKRKLDRLPQNPSERNFWRLLKSQWIPDETYSYVLSIVAAVVICEDPQHFGFTFENPLATL